MNFLCETEFVIQLYNRAVVENALAGDITEHLVRDHAHNFEIEGFVAIDERMESAVETTVV